MLRSLTEHEGEGQEVRKVHSPTPVYVKPPIDPTKRVMRHFGTVVVEKFQVSRCSRCLQFAIWHGTSLIHPETTSAPPLNPDLDEDVKKDYDEAALIVGKSPRGAAALLRLALQKMCSALEPGERDLNEAIANLVKGGLDPRIQQALDIVRVVGNNAVHPGQIDFGDDAAVASRLFELINLIADRLISQPRRVDKLYGALPDSAKTAIEQRDGGESGVNPARG